MSDSMSEPTLVTDRGNIHAAVSREPKFAECLNALEQEKNFFLQIRITRPETFKEDDFILKDYHEP